MSYFDKFWQRVQRDQRLISFDLNTYVDSAGYKAIAGNQDRMKFKNLDSKITASTANSGTSAGAAAAKESWTLSFSNFSSH